MTVLILRFLRFPTQQSFVREFSSFFRSLVNGETAAFLEVRKR